MIKRAILTLIFTIISVPIWIKIFEWIVVPKNYVSDGGSDFGYGFIIFIILTPIATFLTFLIIWIYSKKIISKFSKSKDFKFLTILTLLSLNLNAQNNENNLRISGSLKLLVGLEILTPEKATLQIKPTYKVSISDSLGNFHFENLKPGKYNLQVIGFGYQNLDTLVTLENESLEDLNLLIVANCEVNREIAERDIKKKKPKLLLVGSIAPVVYPDQYKFEKKFKIEYYDFGCVTPANECIIQYNERIFEYLDEKYGKSWRKEVRTDVIGFKKYKKTKR